MNSFEAKYISILRSQVIEEINFLELNGHKFNPVIDPCMFCYKNRDGQFSCGRLSQLRQFMATLDNHSGRESPQSTVMSTNSQPDMTISMHQMPLMFPKP